VKSFGFFGILLIVTFACSACDYYRSSPQVIKADGEIFVACGSGIWTSSEGGGLLGGDTTFKISFTDPDGIDHLLRGVKKVSMTDIPKMVAERMPESLPAPDAIDRNGKPYE
jgi:hypothetical protein